MNPALVFLVRRSLRNRVLQLFVRLRQPRYLVPSLLGVAYFALLIGMQVMNDGGAPPEKDLADLRRMFHWMAMSGFVLMCGIQWFLPRGASPLHFLESEVANLFPAPVTRMDLIRFKLLSMQPPLVFSCAMMTLFVGLRFASESIWLGLTFALGTWVGLNILSLHNIAVQFLRANLFGQGIDGLRRALPATLALASYVVTVVMTIPWPVKDRWVGGRITPEGVITYLVGVEDSFGGTLLFPVLNVVSLPFSEGPVEFLLRLLMAMAVAGGLYLLIVRLDVSFEEAAAEQATKVAAQLEAFRKGGLGAMGAPTGKPRRALWTLKPRGSIEGAFLWRAFTAATRNVSPFFAVFVLVLVPAVLAYLQSKMPDNDPMPAPVASGILVGLALLASQTGQGLRRDMEKVELLKTLPIEPSRFVRSAILAAAAPVIVLQGLAILLAALLLPTLPPDVPMPEAWILAGCIGLLCLLPSLTITMGALHSAVVLSFPAWSRPRPEGETPGGIEGMGQGILRVLVTALGLMLLSIVPGLLAGALAAVTIAFAPPVLHPAGACGAFVLAAVLFLVQFRVLSVWLGTLWARLDPADAGL